MATSYDALKQIVNHSELIEPYGNYVVVKLLEKEESSSGGIFIPDEVRDRDKQMLARALAVGPGMHNLMDGAPIEPLTSVGDLLIILKHAPTEVNMGGEITYIVSEGDILGKVNKKALKKMMGKKFSELSDSLKEFFS